MANTALNNQQCEWKMYLAWLKQCSQTRSRFKISAEWSHIRWLPTSLWDSTLEVVATGDQMECTVNLSWVRFSPGFSTVGKCTTRQNIWQKRVRFSQNPYTSYFKIAEQSQCNLNTIHLPETWCQLQSKKVLFEFHWVSLLSRIQREGGQVRVHRFVLCLGAQESSMEG